MLFFLVESKTFVTFYIKINIQWLRTYTNFVWVSKLSKMISLKRPNGAHIILWYYPSPLAVLVPSEGTSLPCAQESTPLRSCQGEHLVSLELSEATSCHSFQKDQFAPLITSEGTSIYLWQKSTSLVPKGSTALRTCLRENFDCAKYIALHFFASSVPSDGK